MSLFGSTTQNKPSLFGNLVASSAGTQQQQQSQQPQGNNGLFGASQPQHSGNSLFGSLGQHQTQQPSQSSGNLFGSLGQTLRPPQQTNSSFGNQQNQANPQTNGLFGSSLQPQKQSTDLFGNQNSTSQNTGLFGAQSQPQQQTGGLFGQQTMAGSGFGVSQMQSQQLGRSLWQPSNSIAPREKTIPEQMQTLLEKWSPVSSTCLFQFYFYNHVNPETIPYYGPGEGEDEAKWEEALSNKQREDAVPVICRGFTALGNRLRIQVQSVSALQARLHEINNSLTAMLQAHDADISVRANDARRRHTALSQRTLRLATSIQVLRNRGYALDGAEEGLRKKLQELEKGAFDPRLNGRQEEIWARMVQLRERTRILQELAGKAGAGSTDGRVESLDQDILKQTKKILDDYDKQIAYLMKQMEAIRKEFESL